MKTLDDFTMKSKKPWEVEGVECREVKLGEVCTINPKKSEVRDLLSQNVEVSFIPMEYVDDTEGKIVKMDTKPLQAVYKGYTYFKEGDVLFAKITPCMENGKSAIARNLKNGIGFGSTEFHVLRPKENIASEFIFYFIRRKRFRNLAKLHFTGTVGHKRVPKEFLIDSKIPLPFRNGKPDLETQKKIVEYIEANFSRIDKILEKKKKELEKLDELWESVLEQAFKPKEGEEWREIKFLDKINLVKGTKPKSSVKEEREDTLPYLTTEYFREKIIKEYIPIEKNKITLVNDGDLVIIADGSRSGELFFCDMKGVLVSTMAKFEFNESDINKKYLFWFLTTHFEHLNKSKYTATPHVNKNHLKTLKIPLPFRNNQPDIEKQKEIANYLDSVYEKIKTLKEKIQNQITQLEEMKESILDEVFNHDETK